MNVELIMTTKKLSKSLVNQMQVADLGELDYGEVLGFMIGIVKDSYKSLLIKRDGNYFTIPATFTKGVKSLYRRVGKWTYSIDFESEIDCQEFWDLYQKAVAAATTQIYI